MNAIPVSALALCVIPYGPSQFVEETLVQLLAGALDTLNKENCSLIGGHTTEGRDLSLGFSINGQVLPTEILRKGPIKLFSIITLIILQ